MREWLTVIIVLLIAGILLDGLRRVRKARRETLRVSRNARKLDREDMPEVSTELGEPRVVRQRDTRDAQKLTRSMRESYVKSRLTAGAPNRIPEQVALNLQESVPMLMESVEEAGGQGEPVYNPDYTQPPSWADSEPPRPEPRRVPREEQEHTRAVKEPSLGSLDDLDESQAPSHQKAAMNVAAEEAQESNVETAAREAEEGVEPEEVLIINLMAPAGQRFDGSELLQALLDQGLRFGAMDIFHRHQNADGSGPVQFSLANMVVPGTFDLSAMSQFSTPGVSMFLSLPCGGDSLRAFESMVSTAKALAEQLGGELKDENRSVMTRQTIEHCRQRVLEFERRQRLHQ